MVVTDREDVTTLVRLATPSGGEPAFLQPHHLAAAVRLERLLQRARMAPRVTMSYDPADVGGRSGSGNGTGDISDTAADARQRLNKLAATLPVDCWGVVFDVCGLGKRLPEVEMDRRWPRRSAKLVLRIGLEQLAGLFGLLPEAVGKPDGHTRGWLEERLPLVRRDALTTSQG